MTASSNPNPNPNPNPKPKPNPNPNPDPNPNPNPNPNQEIPEGAEASHYMHLNIDVESAIPKDALGFLAELAGVRPLSSMTKMLLETPTKRVAKKKSGGDKRALQAE